MSDEHGKPPVRVLKRWRDAAGVAPPNLGNRKRIQVVFDPDMFRQIESLADDAGISFAEQVRRMVRYHLDHTA